jgi:Domain of unknown function (DUF5753)
MCRMQDSRRPLYERTRLFKAYCPSVMPGFLQTPQYAHALLSAITAFRGTPDDVDEAVAARVKRNRIVDSGNHRFVLLVEETVLRYQVGGVGVLEAQLGYLLEAASLPAVSLGVIPFSAVAGQEQRPLRPVQAAQGTEGRVGAGAAAREREHARQAPPRRREQDARPAAGHRRPPGLLHRPDPHPPRQEGPGPRRSGS